jgi:hypothetical protein
MHRVSGWQALNKGFDVEFNHMVAIVRPAEWPSQSFLWIRLGNAATEWRAMNGAFHAPHLIFDNSISFHNVQFEIVDPVAGEVVLRAADPSDPAGSILAQAIELARRS